MAKAKKIPPALKGRITKLFKGGMLLPDIRQKVIDENWFDVPIPRIKTILKAHFMDHCDALWSEAVKLKADNLCAVDNKRCSLNSHHLRGRSNYKYRWDVNNGVCLGVYRHTLAHDLCAHGSTSATQAFADWMILNRYAQWEWFQRCVEDHELVKVDVYFLLETARRLETAIEHLKNQPKPDILARKKVE